MSSCLSTTHRKPSVRERFLPDRWEHESIHTIAEIKPLCEAVASSMNAAGFGNRDVFAVRLALEEAVINAIKHGHQGDPRKTVRVGYRVAGDEALINVEDEGAGFDPYEVADPLSPENLERSTGRGLLLMRHYMTWVKHDGCGNRVTLCRCRTC
jgi:serine/threonine-protein kinase RsbW